MSLPDRGPAARARNVAWLERRQSDGWFFARNDNYAFGSASDATAFKQWLMAETV